MARLGAQDLVAKTVEMVVIEWNRPDVAALLLLQIMDEGKPEVRTAAMAPPVARGRHTGLMHTMHCLLLNGLVLPAANLAVALARQGEAAYVADLLTAMVEGGALEDARDIFAVIICRGHEDVVQMVGYWMIRSEHSGAMARITVALVDSGGLLLACVARNSMAILGESLVGQPSYELVRMGRVDVLARMLIVLVSQNHSGIVCACFKGLHRMGRHEVLARATLAIAQMGRPDIIALMQAMLVHGGGGAAAKLCMDQMIRISHPWVAAVAKIEMVHKGLSKEVAILETGPPTEDTTDLECSTLLLRAGYACEWATIMHEVLNMGRLDIIAQCLAGLIELRRTHLAVEGMRALAQTATDKALAEVVQGMVEAGHQEAAAELLAELAHSALSMACDILGHADTGAQLLLLRLAEPGRVAAVVRISNALIESDHIRAAAAIATALPEDCDVPRLMEALRDAGARILPEVWHRASMRYFSTFLLGSALKPIPPPQVCANAASAVAVWKG
ncbi:g3825 [Coccomyxa elongata]